MTPIQSLTINSLPNNYFKDLSHHVQIYWPSPFPLFPTSSMCNKGLNARTISNRDLTWYESAYVRDQIWYYIQLSNKRPCHLFFRLEFWLKIQKNSVGILLSPDNWTSFRKKSSWCWNLLEFLKNSDYKKTNGFTYRD